MAETDERQLLDWDALEIGETFPPFEYVLTQERLDQYRQAVDDPEADFPTLGFKHAARIHRLDYDPLDYLGHDIPNDEYYDGKDQSDDQVLPQPYCSISKPLHDVIRHSYNLLEG